MGIDPDRCGFGFIELRRRITARRRLAGRGPVSQQMYCVPRLAAPQAAQRPGMESLFENNGNPHGEPWAFDRITGNGNHSSIFASKRATGLNMNKHLWKKSSALLLLWAICVVPFTAYAEPFEQLGVTRPRTSKPAPDFVLKDIHGRPISLSQFKGKPVLLNFWATWCGPCREELPSMQRMHDASKKNGGFHVVAISIDRFNMKKVSRYAQDLNLDFPILLDPDRETRKAYFIRGLPTSYLIDSEGKLRGFVSGARDWDNPASLELMKSLH
jgi:cytochrome c biogenesis protein CcmG, thiol:disulfide interchange protein DsbE